MVIVQSRAMFATFPAKCTGDKFGGEVMSTACPIGREISRDAGVYDLSSTRWVTAAVANTMTPATRAGHGRFTARLTQPMAPATDSQRGHRRSCRSSVYALALAIA